MAKIQKAHLTPSKWARPQIKLGKVRGLVWHWVANPNSTAMGNRNFFNNRSGSYGSAQYIIGLQGEVIQAMPELEMAYHVGSHVYTQKALRELGSYPNNSTIGIECTHIDWNGKMTNATYNSLIDLSVDILKRHNLTVDDIWLHQEVVGWKDCHRYYVNNPSEYKFAKLEVAKKMNQKLKNPPTKVDPKEVEMPSTGSNGSYTVQKGDTLWGISQAFSTTVSNLEKLNPNVNATSLKIGTKIKVPSSAKTVSKWTKVSGNWTGQTLYEGQYGEPVKQLQQKLKNKGYLKSNQVDSYYGNVTKNAVKQAQKTGKVYVDGLAGKQTYKILTSAHSKPKAKLVEDGYWGKELSKTLQRYFKTVVDGEIWGQYRNQATLAITGGVKYGTGGSPMIKNLQSKVGSKADGYLGANTVRSMQRYLKTPADGIISQPSTMVKELQRRLNSGTF